MHTAHLLAFILFTVAAILAAFERSLPVALVAAGLAVNLTPTLN